MRFDLLTSHAAQRLIDARELQVPTGPWPSGVSQFCCNNLIIKALKQLSMLWRKLAKMVIRVSKKVSQPEQILSRGLSPA